MKDMVKYAYQSTASALCVSTEALLVERGKERRKEGWKEGRKERRKQGSEERKKSSGMRIAVLTVSAYE